MAKADEGYDGRDCTPKLPGMEHGSAKPLKDDCLFQRTTGKAMGDYGCMLRAYRRHIVDAMLYRRECST